MNLRVVCVGSGYWGKNLVRNCHALGVLAGICDTDPDVRESTAQVYPDVRFFGSFADVLAEETVDAVLIATPATSHGMQVRQALLAGKDVFVEKPLCLSVREGEELVELAAQRGRVLMVGHLLWYHPAVVRLKQLVDHGELGRIQYVYSNRLNLGRIRREENILWSFAPHDISVILGLLGETPATVSAEGGKYLHERIEDVTVSQLAFPSGVRAHIFVSWLHPFKEQKLVVVGDRQMAVFDDLSPSEKLILYPHSISWRNHLPVAHKAEAVPVRYEADEPLRAECEHFLECVATRARPRTDGEEALRVLRVLHELQVQLDRSRAAPVQTRSETQYFVHESSYIDDDVRIGLGTSIWHFSHVLPNSTIGERCRIGQNVVIGPNAQIGNGVKIQNNVSVYEGVELEDHVFCGPSVVFTNVYNPRSEIARMSELRHTLVRRGATLGANCTIVCGVSIGEYAFVGAGAVVVRDVPPYALVVGNPAKVIGFVCACGMRLPDQESRVECAACGKQYSRANGELTRVSQQLTAEPQVELATAGS